MILPVRITPQMIIIVVGRNNQPLRLRVVICLDTIDPLPKEKINKPLNIKRKYTHIRKPIPTIHHSLFLWSTTPEIRIDYGKFIHSQVRREGFRARTTNAPVDIHQRGMTGRGRDTSNLSRRHGRGEKMGGGSRGKGKVNWWGKMAKTPHYLS